MSTRLYDLDSSGGLMEQIQSLIAPPGNEKKEKEKKPEHPYFKRPGKGHNHDFCDACEEGGDLICCDKCPSSFHWGCHDPPLNFEDIPVGEWLCHSCKYQKSQLVVLRKRSESTSSTSSSSGSKSVKKPKPSALECLIEAATAMNPKQFELPFEMDLPTIAFPGDEKAENLGVTKRPKQRDFEKLPNGLVPLPARKCAECSRSCRVAPLIECDFCNSYYHLDCLDPPLTAPPAGVWMCPLHVEHTLDSTLLTSISVCERVKLWDKFSTPVDQDAVKLEFFRKVQRKNPPFRVKRKLPLKLKIQVPEMIKYHYKKPVQLLPSLKDVLRIEAAYRKSSIIESEVASSTESCQGSVEDKNDEEDTAQNDNDDEVSKLCDTSDLSKNSKASLQNPTEDVHIKMETSPVSPSTSSGTNIKITNNTYYTNNVLNVNFKCSSHENGGAEEKCHNDTTNSGLFDRDLVKKEQNMVKDIMEGYFNYEADLELKQLDERVLKILAFQRLQQIVESFNHSSSAGNLKMPLPSELLTPADIDRISRVFASPKKKPRVRSIVRARAMLCPVVSKHFYNVRTREVDSTDVRHDASFMGFRPTVSTRFPEAVAMRYRVLNVGKGSSNEVDLEKFGYCNFISFKHATIFFDDYTNSYELINYAPAGTYVNNVLYSNNMCIKRSADVAGDSADGGEKVQGASMTPEEKAANVEAQVRDVINRKRKFGRSDNVGSNGNMGKREAKMTADYIDRFECCCSTAFEDMKRGWEGSAILNHGSLLKFGCISFVFSIVENL
ncbi:PHD finger protein 12 [Euwallacea fornicatus]|uniref:PHD finger protein 12 n=1 Tax=Euwallacea fornicatus TaxID=995702 RepID=UPI00338DF449